VPFLYDDAMEKIDISKIRTLTDLNLLYEKKEVTASTNDDLKALASIKTPDRPVVLFADKQTAGRGRQGRSFYSEGGLYMSVLFPKLDAQAAYLTHVAAVAVAEGIREETGLPASVKWVNDIYLSERKICGILSESITPFGARNYIVGIGINVGTPKRNIPSDIRDIIGYIDCDKNALAARILRKLFTLTGHFDLPSLKERYTTLCFLNGKRVNVVRNDIKKPATVLGLTDELRLRVRYDDRQTEDLIAGEVRLIV